MTHPHTHLPNNTPSTCLEIIFGGPERCCHLTRKYIDNFMMASVTGGSVSDLDQENVVRNLVGKYYRVSPAVLVFDSRPTLASPYAPAHSSISDENRRSPIPAVHPNPTVKRVQSLSFCQNNVRLWSKLVKQMCGIGQIRERNWLQKGAELVERGGIG
jgi:hypothetical protein